MWTATTKTRDDGAVEVTAIFASENTTPFSWSATIKANDIDTFVQEAKKQLDVFQSKHSVDDTLKTNLEAALNK